TGVQTCALPICCLRYTYPLPLRPFRKAQHQKLETSKTTVSPSLPEPLITVVGKAKQQTFVPGACDQLQTHRFSFVGQACRKAEGRVVTEVECPGQSDTDRPTGAVVAMGRIGGGRSGDHVGLSEQVSQVGIVVGTNLGHHIPGVVALYRAKRLPSTSRIPKLHRTGDMLDHLLADQLLQ